MLGVVIVSLITGNHYLTIYGTGYVNLSMFLAFAVLFPDVQVLLFFIIPVKMKWLAYIDGAVFVLGIIQSLVRGSVVGVVLPIVAMLNFIVFIWPEIQRLNSNRRYRNSRQATQFRQAVHQQQRQENVGYHHKCAVCGRTDTDLSRSAVPLLQQVRGVSLLLSGSYLFARSFYGVNMQAAPDLK